jgi:hypothetical protein
MDIGYKAGLGAPFGVADVMATLPGLQANLASHFNPFNPFQSPYEDTLKQLQIPPTSSHPNAPGSHPTIRLALLARTELAFARVFQFSVLPLMGEARRGAAPSGKISNPLLPLSGRRGQGDEGSYERRA